MRQIRWLCLIIGVLPVGWFGCGTENKSLLEIQEEIRKHPQKYSMQTESLGVRGKVVDFLTLPDQQTVFKIDDGSGGYLWISSAKKHEKEETYEGVGKIKIGLSMIDRAYGILFIEDPPELAASMMGEQTTEGGKQ
jgi:hypothetical protein